MIPSILTFRWWLFGLLALAGLLIIAYLAVGGSTPTVSGEAPNYNTGDVFAGVGDGLIRRFNSDGVPQQDLDTSSSSKEQSGMCIDGGGNIYSTNYTAGTMSKFDLHENLLDSEWVGPFGSVPQDCKIDAVGNIYVGSDDGLGAFDGVAPLRRFSPSGQLIGEWSPELAHRGTNWFDLAEDQCTILYTSDIGSIKQFNVCDNSGTGAQMADFASGLQGPCYAVRIRPNGDVMVACLDEVVRLPFGGGPNQIYPAKDYRFNDVQENWFLAMNLDPDGDTFWTGGYLSGVIYRINIETGRLVNSFHSGIDPSNGDRLAGLAIVGEILVGEPPNEPPDCSSAVASQTTLWPPNHQMETVTVVISDPNSDPITVTIRSIFQDEPTDTSGNSNFAPDGEIVGDGSALLRAERIGNPRVPGNGRVYTITYTADDGVGGECSGEVLVGVPHDNRPDGDAVDNGPDFDSTQIN